MVKSFVQYITLHLLILDMLQIFDNLDANGDGKLDRFEFPSEATRVFHLLDSNKDRYVTPEEIEEMIQKPEARATHPNVNNEEPVDSDDDIYTPSSFDDGPGDMSDNDDF